MADESKRKAVADRYFIDANGNKVDKIEEATGFGYRYLSEDKAFEMQLADSPGSAAAMLACFGGVTLAGNTASGWSQGREGDAATAYDANVARFGLIANGAWRTRGEGGRGPKWDNATLAEAIVRAKGDNAEGDAAFYLEKLESDAAYRRRVNQVDAVTDIYHELRGTERPTVDLDDI